MTAADNGSRLRRDLPEKSGGNLSEHVYRRLSDLILQKKLPGGTPIIEGRLADELDVSRTPMREALGRLAGEGLLVRTTPRSYSVRHVTPSEFFQSMRVRETLECQAIEMAFDRVPPEEVDRLGDRIASLAEATTQESAHWQADDDLHQIFARHCGNEVLAKMIQTLRTNTRLFELSRPFQRVKEDGFEHLAILAAVKQGDCEAAKAAMLMHLKNLQHQALQTMTGRSDIAR